MLHHHQHYWQKIPAIGMILLILGLVGGIAFRLTFFVKPWGQDLVDVIWYIGVGAYTIFYFVRISIENHRREICESAMLHRLKTNTLTVEDTGALYDMVSSHCRSKVKYNYEVWLAISLLSLVSAIFLTN